MNFVTYHNSDGTINEYVYLTLDEEELSAKGYNFENTKSEIQTNARKITNDLITDYNTKLLQAYRDNKISLEEYDKFNNGVAMIEQDWLNNEYIIGLQFQNSATYRKYYQLLNNIEEDIVSEPTTIKKTFYTKTYYYGTIGYADYNLFNEIYSYYSFMFIDIPTEKTSLEYSYAVNSKRYHSNADSISMDNNGNYIHTWSVEPDELEKEIYFYTIKANRSMWILVSIGIALSITLILCIIGLFKYNQSKKHKSIEIENIENLE